MKKNVNEKLMTLALTLTMLFGATAIHSQTVDMDLYVTLRVQSGQRINITFRSDAEGTPVRIVCGDKITDTVAGTTWVSNYYDAVDDTIKVYGGITQFNCGLNGANLTAVDPTHNASLTFLYCSKNHIDTLDISKNTALETLHCAYNRLTSLDVSKNVLLESIKCNDNYLQTLDLSNNIALTSLFCYGNQLSDCALDEMFVSLPMCQEDDYAEVYIKNAEISNPGADGCRTPIAVQKHWSVRDWNGIDTDFEINNTTFTCQESGIGMNLITDDMILYPNPAISYFSLTTKADVKLIQIFSVDGVKLAEAVSTKSVDLSRLQVGIYLVRIMTDMGVGTLRIVKQ